jgi:Tol biopolymer transport system component
MESHRKLRVALLATVTAAAVLAISTPASATFPGHNGRIAYSADAGSGAQIYTVGPHGHGLRQITHLAGDSVNPDWSPDGRSIVFESDAPEGVSVEVMRSDGTHLHNLTPTTVCCNGDPSYTPDGRRIVYSSSNPDTNEQAIWSIKLDGSGLRRITGLSTGATDPNVSPDGRTLTFRSGDGLPGENGALFRTGIDGGAVTRITPFAFVSIKHDWAPNLRRIIYSDGADTGDPTISTNIATVAPDGSLLRHLTNFQGGAFSAFAGSYSPDGRKIVLRLEDHGSYALYTARPDGSHFRLLIALGTLKPRVSDWGARSPDERSG